MGRLAIGSSTQALFAGGLSPDNVAEVIQSVAPFGLDVCSGLRPNRSLDVTLLRRFIANATAVYGA
ncbi:MAG: hypothetical protein GWQ05_22385 [Verrucomicrobiaceae bacterium]|nr:hypothetical protein [Verrucomicrobiaceae bacterium]